MCFSSRVSTTTDSLPNDLESLRALALKAIAERDVAIADRTAALAERDAERAEKAKLAADRDRLQGLYEHVHHLLRKAADHRFGAKNERLDRLPSDQLQLALEDIEASLAKNEAVEEKKARRLPRTGTRKRGALPKHLPRIDETVAPPATCCPCCSAPMHMIGEETSERLDVVPAQYRVIVTHRPKFACRACEKVVQENAPEHLIKLPDDAITLAFCWAHVRRGFFEIARKGNAPIATQALLRIAALYRIEATIRGKRAEERCTVRREQSAPHCEALKRFLEKQLGRVSAKAPIAQAIRYALKHWQGLTRFLDDGRIDLDSNIVERAMRPQALTRKNALFAGHDDGAESWAIVASLIETCKLSGIDPYRYLAEILSRLVNLWPNARLDELLPWNWAAARDHLQRAA
jgi:transposase